MISPEDMAYSNGQSKGTAAIRGKDDDKKLFVGGLPKPCSEKELRDTFAKYGEIESIHIKMDPYTGLSRGFCFIVFSNPNVVQTILSSGDIIINGKKVDPRKITKSSTPGKLFIGGLTPEFTEEKIKQHFGQYGVITEIQWPIDKRKNQRKAFCFLTFENRDTVIELLKRPKQTVCGKELDVKRVKFNPETMWAQSAAVGAYTTTAAAATTAARPRAAYPAYGYTYPNYTYECSAEYPSYDDYYGYEYADPYYDYTTGYEAYSPTYSASYTAPRPPRSARPAVYQRHAPY